MRKLFFLFFICSFVLLGASKQTTLDLTHLKQSMTSLKSFQEQYDNIEQKLTQNHKNKLLIEAARKNSLPIVTWLIDQGANVNCRSKGYDTSKFFSNKEDKYRTKATPLHFAAKNGNLKMAELLVEKGACVNAHLYCECMDIALATPLHFAAQTGNLELVTFLVRNGASITAHMGMKSFGGQKTPAFLAELASNETIKEFLWREEWNLIEFLKKNGAEAYFEGKYKNKPQKDNYPDIGYPYGDWCASERWIFGAKLYLFASNDPIAMISLINACKKNNPQAAGGG